MFTNVTVLKDDPQLMWTKFSRNACERPGISERLKRSSKKEHKVDALALRAEERRDKLR